LITGRTPAESVRSYRDTLQRTVSCVTSNVLVLARNATAQAPVRHDLTLSNSPAPLTGPGRIALNVGCRFLVVSKSDEPTVWQVRTIGYFYTVSEMGGREILAYHWHPAGASHEVAPHLHLEAGAELGRADLAGTHLPTGTVELPDVLRFVIRHLRVRPLRRNWAEILDCARTSLA
jgi:hypothetical protein